MHRKYLKLQNGYNTEAEAKKEDISGRKIYVKISAAQNNQQFKTFELFLEFFI